MSERPSPDQQPRPIKPARRVGGIHYAVRDVTLLADRLAREGRRMSYLNIGDPNPYGFRTPSHVVEAVHRAMQDNHNGYAHSDGVPEALEAVRRDAARKGLDDPVYVWVGNGCSEVIDMALTALVERGDNVLTPTPGYPLYTALLTKLEAESRPYHFDEENGWQPDLEDVAARIDERTRALVVINPNNPTGSVASEETLRGLVELAGRHGLLVISDEIYDRLLLEGERHVAVASLSREVPVLTLGGLSKNWVAPGWRIGWGILTGEAGRLEGYVEGVRQLGRARLSANHPEQFAIRPALEGPQDHLEAMVGELTRRRDLAMRLLNAVPGISCVPPRGAFYAFPRLPDGTDDAAWAAELMRATGVVVVHGSGFGQRPGTSHFRIVLLPEPAELERACNLIGDFVAGQGAARG